MDEETDKKIDGDKQANRQPGIYTDTNKNRNRQTEIGAQPETARDGQRHGPPSSHPNKTSQLTPQTTKQVNKPQRERGRG